MEKKIVENVWRKNNKEVDVVRIPDKCNYVGLFLTFACNMHCSYCINNYSSPVALFRHAPVDDWASAINRLELRPDLPVTLQGGEPTLYPQFTELISKIKPDINIDILTNGMFNINQFFYNIPPDRLKRDAKYASIRFSYHPGFSSGKNLLDKVKAMKNRGYSVGIWAVNKPDYRNVINKLKFHAEACDIDFRIKEYLGEFEGKMYGSYKYPEAIDGKEKSCVCEPSEILVAPDGSIHRCHHYLYSNKKTKFSFFEKHTNLEAVLLPKPCDCMGKCNLCDIKLKFNRFQEEGHCSVIINQGETC